MSRKARAEQKESSPSLPEEIIVDIVARVPRSYYPTISLVSKSLRSLVASPELYTRRSLLGCTEQYLYVLFSKGDDNRIYILHRNANSKNRLVMIRSLPPMPCYARYVAVGSKIYVVGEVNPNDMKTSNNLIIDCTSHTVQPISRFPTPMAPMLAQTIDGKIYVIGRCWCDDKVSGKGFRNRVVVLDTVTQEWEPEVTKPDMELGYLWNGGVMEDKIYMQNREKSFSYAPKENKWELDEMLDSEDWKGACVLDDVLYSFEEEELRAYDPKQMRWGAVKGLEALYPEIAGSWKPVSYGGKLAIFFIKRNDLRKETMEIWCAEIALERRQGGEIWGKVQWCDVVFDDVGFYMLKCLVVTV